MSHTLHIRVPDTLYDTLTKTARQTGQPLEAIASRWLAVVAEQLAHDPLDAFIGAFNSGGSDWADQHDRYLGEMGIRENATSDLP